MGGEATPFQLNRSTILLKRYTVLYKRTPDKVSDYGPSYGDITWQILLLTFAGMILKCHSQYMLSTVSSQGYSWLAALTKWFS